MIRFDAVSKNYPNGTTAVERLEAEKTVMGSIVGHGAVRCATGRRVCRRQGGPRHARLGA